MLFVWLKAADLTWSRSLQPHNPRSAGLSISTSIAIRQKKKAHDSKRGSAGSAVKEVKMGALTEKHDVEFKVKHIRRFVGEGQRVKLSVSFRGRQITHPELGRSLIDGIIEQVRDIAQPEGNARMEGRNMSVLLTPR